MVFFFFSMWAPFWTYKRTCLPFKMLFFIFFSGLSNFNWFLTVTGNILGHDKNSSVCFLSFFFSCERHSEPTKRMCLPFKMLFFFFFLHSQSLTHFLTVTGNILGHDRNSSVCFFSIFFMWVPFWTYKRTCLSFKMLFFIFLDSQILTDFWR